jgi:segregation and condensation protein B
MNTDLSKKIEALLLYTPEGYIIQKLSNLCGASTEEIKQTLKELEEILKERGIRVQTNGEEVRLVTAPEYSELIAKIQKDTLERDLGKAGLETLAIIAYKGPITRTDIDYIRGVNSSFTLRTLLVRGLIQKVPHTKEQRSFLYLPTNELLSFLGVETITELPHFEKYLKEIEAFIEKEEESQENDK